MKYIKKCITWAKAIVFRIINKTYELRYPVQKNKVCFLSDVRDVMGGNLKCVYDYLENRNYERVIEFRADRRVRRNWKQLCKLIYNLTTSKYILLDDYSSAINHFHVRKGQEIVQLWHGPGAFKKFGWSRKTNGEAVGGIHKGYKKYTKAIVSGKGITSCYAEAFAIPESRVHATGFPRTDDFFNEAYIEETEKRFYKEYPEFKEKKIILFAPTYRGTLVQDASYDFSQMDLEKLYEKFHEEYVFMIKWHPALYNNLKFGVVEAPDFEKYNGFFVDFSQYREINDLLLVCDCLITDYSSMIFDYVLLNKPIVYFAYDLDEYTNYGGRGLYFDFEEYVYGPVAYNEGELLEAISNNDLMLEKRKVFYDKFMGECDGHSTEKTCRWIFGE